MKTENFNQIPTVFDGQTKIQSQDLDSLMAQMLQQTKAVLNNSSKLNQNLKKYEIENKVNIYDLTNDDENEENLPQDGQVNKRVQNIGEQLKKLMSSSGISQTKLQVTKSNAMASMDTMGSTFNSLSAIAATSSPPPAAPRLVALKTK